MRNKYVFNYGIGISVGGIYFEGFHQADFWTSEAQIFELTMEDIKTWQKTVREPSIDELKITYTIFLAPYKGDIRQMDFINRIDPQILKTFISKTFASQSIKY